MAHLHVKTPNGTTYSIDLDAINADGGSIPDSGNNGWGVLTNGAILQWGQDTEPNVNNPSKDITFPIEFTSVFTALVCNSFYTDVDYFGCAVVSLTVSGFTYKSCSYGGNALYWIALGD